jgi:hypothetical protein
MRSKGPRCGLWNWFLPPFGRLSPVPAPTHRAPLDEFCDAALPSLQQGYSELIGFGPTDAPEFRHMLETAEPFFKASAARFPVTTYSEG